MASLQELPDDELDKLFRSSAEEFEPPYNADDWNSLRQRLDEDDRSRFLYRFIYWGLPLLLLLLTTVSLVVPPDEVRPPASKTGIRTEPVSTPGTGRSSAIITEKENPATAGNKTLSEKPAEKIASARAESTPETGAGSTGRPSVSEVSGSKAMTTPSLKPTNENRSVLKNRPEKTARALRKRSEATVSGNPTNADQTVSAVSETKSKLTRTRLSKIADYAAVPPIVKNRRTQPVPNFQDPAYSAVVPGEPLLAQPRETEAPVLESEPLDWMGNLTYITARPPAKPVLPSLPELDLEPVRPPVGPRVVAPAIPVIGYPALAVRFIAAPDLNFVGKSRQAAGDFEIGVLAEYRFLRRLTIQSGVLRSVKKYTAPASDYAKPAHWYGPKYESVGAVCTVLDIPVNLRFDVMLNDRRRWFISSGVSSYIMQKEYYQYQYPAGVTPTQARYKEWSGSTGFHRFSHLNVSIGYERNFRSDGPLRRFSWQVEPFLKSPLSKLGYGKIRLTSTGVFFSLRYRL
ncbi:hypothetical protein [Larkinella punicea]|uniref:PorT family protein n=1 Tax=Larkinella punicea TaxID=2315727 RepID=A0A368JGF8_9BACT|nr:hypothetical protein [Larkinella punicea]RCR65623.1 hypothetical protein DUE52_30975 [Larkinella punicea]